MALTADETKRLIELKRASRIAKPMYKQGDSDVDELYLVIAKEIKLLETKKRGK